MLSRSAGDRRETKKGERTRFQRIVIRFAGSAHRAAHNTGIMFWQFSSSHDLNSVMYAGIAPTSHGPQHGMR